MHHKLAKSSWFPIANCIAFIMIVAATLTVQIASAEELVKSKSETNKPPAKLADHPKVITSFGAARIGDRIYTYGGHLGKPHHYYREGQNDTLRELDLKSPNEWKDIAKGPGLQGMALVAHGEDLYRVGGFEARNAEDDEQDLHSLAEFARFDFETKKWQRLDDLPDGRSSFDAIVNGDTLFVVGGWKMSGEDGEKVWHKEAYSRNLADENADWMKLPTPPFQRRALAIAATEDSLFVIGGMREKGGPTTRTDIFDFASHRWRKGPVLPGESIAGFGAAALNLEGRIYVSTVEGELLVLSKDGKQWNRVTKYSPGRFFHRMISIDANSIALIGGANMETGKIRETIVLKTGE